MNTLLVVVSTILLLSPVGVFIFSLGKARGRLEDTTILLVIRDHQGEFEVES